MFSLLIKGMYRRKKEVLPVLLVTLIVTFFMSGVLMAQSILKDFIREQNRENYGDWVIASTDGELSHPYLTDKGYLKKSLVIYDSEGNSTGFTVGCVDESLTAFARIRLYEGHLPENENEIAADLNTLQQTGHSYELGQEITLYWKKEGADDEEPVFLSKTYTLCGTVKPFNTLWKSAGRIPKFIVTEEELNTIDPGEALYYYRFDPSLNKVDVEEFFRAFQKEHHGLTFNDFVYTDVIWNTEEFYRIASFLMIVVAVFAITWMLFSYTGKRSREYYRLRTLGASRGKLNRLIFAECGLILIPCAVIGIGLAYGIAAVFCAVTAKKVGLNGFFAFDLSVFLTQLIAIFGSILLSIGLVFLRTGDKRLSAGTRRMTEKDVSKIRKRFNKSKAPEKEFFRRQNAVRPGTRLLFILFTLVVMGFLLVCTLKIKDALSVWRDYRQEADYTIDARDKLHSSTGPEWVYRDVYSPYYGLSDEELESLEAVYGISEVRAKRANTVYRYTWDRIYESTLMPKNWYDMFLSFAENGKSLDVSINTYADAEIPVKFARYYGRKLSEEEITAFTEGRLAILFRPTHTEITQNNNYKTIYVGEDPSLKDGEEISLFLTDHKEPALKLPVIILNNEDDLYQNFKPFYQENWVVPYNTGGASLLVSDAVTEALAALQGDQELKWNKLEFRFNQFSSFEATDKMLASFAVKRGYEYYNRMESKRIRLQLYIIRPLLIYGALFIMTLLVYFIIQRNFTELRCRESAAELKRFSLLGMEEKKRSQRILLTKLREYVPVFFGLITGLALTFIQSWLDNKKSLAPGVRERSIHFGSGITADPWLAALDDTLYCGIPLLIIVLAVIYILLTLYSWRIYRKVLKE